ncbi:MAG: glycosyl transferase, partial [Erysipelotrichia bacterium]|nr:glycosyl transferase [Erysipelotrichia bacterium]
MVGGAARAAWRIHSALRKNNLDSSMLVSQAVSGDWSVYCPGNKLAQRFGKFRFPLGLSINKLLRTSNPILHSTAILPSDWPRYLNRSDMDIVHLNWVNGEMMSISDIGNITKPLVWTLHDMWAFCGAEHYTEDYRWKDGYSITNRPPYESGFDLNRWTWQRKRRAWKQPIHIVTPSRWLAECAHQSLLMRDWPITVVPNALDVEMWQPVDRNLARRLMNLPTDCPLLLFGA